MGLDTTAYKNFKLLPGLLEKSKNITDEDRDDFYDSLDEIEQNLAFSYANFPHALEGFGVSPFKLDLPWAISENYSFITVGYVTGEPGPTTQCAYSGHSAYRNAICAYFGVPFGSNLSREMPFYDLLWFADNEGTLGPGACKRLWVDYQEYSAEKLGLTDRLASYHQQWYDATQWASQDGFIDFH